MKAIHKKRMRKLIDFLRKLPSKQFDFGQVIAEAKTNGHTCPTVACAMGWTPVVFPRTVKAVSDGYGGYALALKADKHFTESAYSAVALHLFGLNHSTARGLFDPVGQKLVHKSLPTCNYNATPKQVAKMLEKYLELQEAK